MIHKSVVECSDVVKSVGVHSRYDLKRQIFLHFYDFTDIDVPSERGSFSIIYYSLCSYYVYCVSIWAIENYSSRRKIFPTRVNVLSPKSTLTNTHTVIFRGKLREERRRLARYSKWWIHWISSCSDELKDVKKQLEAIKKDRHQTSQTDSLPYGQM